MSESIINRIDHPYSSFPRYKQLHYSTMATIVFNLITRFIRGFCMWHYGHAGSLILVLVIFDAFSCEQIYRITTITITITIIIINKTYQNPTFNRLDR